MGVREAQRLGPLKAAIEGRISDTKGAELTGMSLRHFKRLKRRVRDQGARGLLHGNRGRPSPRRLPPDVRAQAEALLQRPEPRLNDCHVRDVLAGCGVTISAESVRQLRRALGLAPKNRRRPARHLSRRLRAARVGSLVLMDGSPYAWLGPEQPVFTLIGMLDDATGRPLSLVRRPTEDLHGYVVGLHEMIVHHGVPEALYGDRTGIAVRNDRHWTREEELEGRQQPTQFGRILEELGVHYIAANSPQAKGRIERHWLMLQDRLPAALALCGIRTLEAFDAFLPTFLADCARWFAREPRESVRAWRPAPRQLDRILACRYARTVTQDNVVSIPGCTLQIPPGPYQRSYARARVEVRELLDGRLLVLKDGVLLLEQPAPAGAFTLVPRRSALPARRPRRTRPVALVATPTTPKPRPVLPVGDRELLARQRRKPKTNNLWQRRPYKTAAQLTSLRG